MKLSEFVVYHTLWNLLLLNHNYLFRDKTVWLLYHGYKYGNDVIQKETKNTFFFLGEKNVIFYTCIKKIIKDMENVRYMYLG